MKVYRITIENSKTSYVTFYNATMEQLCKLDDAGAEYTVVDCFSLMEWKELDQLIEKHGK